MDEIHFITLYIWKPPPLTEGKRLNGVLINNRAALTCPPKPDPSTMLQIRQKETGNAEKTTLYNWTDHHKITGSRYIAESGINSRRNLQSAGDQQTDLLPLAKRIRGVGYDTSEKTQKFRKRECQIEKLGRRSISRQRDIEGSALKKVISPDRRRQAVKQAIDAMDISERRACRVLQQPRSTQRYPKMIPEDEYLLRALGCKGHWAGQCLWTLRLP